MFKYDYQKHQAFFAKYLKKQASYQYDFENQQEFQCYFHSRTAMVVIHFILSFSNEEKDRVVGIANYSD